MARRSTTVSLPSPRRFPEHFRPLCEIATGAHSLCFRPSTAKLEQPESDEDEEEDADVTAPLDDEEEDSDADHNEDED